METRSKVEGEEKEKRVVDEEIELGEVEEKEEKMN